MSLKIEDLMTLKVSFELDGKPAYCNIQLPLSLLEVKSANFDLAELVRQKVDKVASRLSKEEPKS